MQHRILLAVMLAAASSMTSAHSAAPVEADIVQSRPNIILIYADDMGYGDLGCYGSRLIRTPRIDQMAEEGVRFTRFYSAASICTPSRAALLTGSYPQRCGLSIGISPTREEDKHLGLHPKEETIPELLRKVGYSTLCVGKWHLGNDPLFHPMNHGFDEYFGMPANFHHSPALLEGSTVIEPETDLSQLTRRYTERVIDFITRKKLGPFFIYLPHTYPHLPVVPNPNFKGKSEADAYGDVIEELDWSTGAIIDLLKELGIDENTLILFSSDNGPHPVFARTLQSAGGLTGSKYSSWEGGQRVPLIARWPGKIPGGRVCSELASTMDVLPTLANLAKAPMPEKEIDGKDIWPLLNGDNTATTPHDVFYYYNGDLLQAVLWQDWKLHLPRRKEMNPWWQKNYGLTTLHKPTLFNIQSDIKEAHDVADRHPEIVNRMLNLAEKGREKFGDYQRRGTVQRATGDSRK